MLRAQFRQGGAMRKMNCHKLLTAFVAMAFSAQAMSSVIAIIDSGTDMLHTDIAPQAWINAVDLPGTDRDEDRNGYQDDVNGWNFAEGNNQVIDYSYLNIQNPEIERFFDLQTKALTGTITEEELNWMRAQIADEEFLKKLQIFGNFMHGTHVGHIGIRGSRDAELLAVKLIPTEVKLPFYLIPSNDMNDKSIRLRLLKEGLKLLASQQMKLMEEIAAYVDGHKADIANGSFGTGYAQASMIVGTLFQTIMRREPTDEELKEVSIVFLNELIAKGKGMVDLAPNTLFVFAAGNDGTNNDTLPTSPANIKADNVISVAATLGYGDIAPFSNFGQSTVDIAAPGVGIRAASPGNKYIRVSGTSQAAPYVASIATQVKDLNPELTPAQIKSILMGTVDVRSELANIVRSSGIANRSRATKAAELTHEMSVDQAISTAKSLVADKEYAVQKTLLPAGVDELVLPLPSPFALK